MARGRDHATSVMSEVHTECDMHSENDALSVNLRGHLEQKWDQGMSGRFDQVHT